LNFEWVGRSLFWLSVCLLVSVFFVLDGKMANFGDCSRTVLAFPKLKKHHPTNIYMLYPMAQSVV
jgi:hypothetical protein